MTARALRLALFFALLPASAHASERLVPIPVGRIADHAEHFVETAPPPTGAIPHGRLAAGSGLRAWYGAPTDRYGHGVLGDAIEAGRLLVSDGSNTLSHALAEDSVFEDLEPRIVDADGDGRPEILTIKSYRRAGATIALFAPRDGALLALAEAPPIGTPNRWLNPAGVADYDGDGRPEIALVETPHIGGVIVLYRWNGSSRLEPLLRWPGYSTHSIGSTVLAMSHNHDWNGDGVTDLILPRQNRAVLAVVTLAGGEPRELAHALHENVIDTALVPIEHPDAGPALLYGLSDGSAWHLALPGGD